MLPTDASERSTPQLIEDALVKWQSTSTSLHEHEKWGGGEGGGGKQLQTKTKEEEENKALLYKSLTNKHRC